MTRKPGAIDIHAHIIPSGYVDALSRTSAEHAPTLTESTPGNWLLTFPESRPSGPLPKGMVDIDERLADMDGMKVWHQAVSPPPVHFFYELPPDVGVEYVRLGNDAMLDASAMHPERLSVLIALPLQDPAAAIRELERVSGNRHVRGVAIGSTVQDKNLDDPVLEPVWEAIAGLDLAVLVHPVDAPGSERMSRYYLRNFVGNPLASTLAMASLIFGGVLERHPRLRFCFPHGGGFGPYQIGRWEHGWQHRPEAKTVITRSPRDYFERLFFDALTHDRLSLKFLLERVGPTRIMLGSDYLYDMADHDPVRHIQELGVSNEVTEALLYGTADRFLRSTG